MSAAPSVRLPDLWLKLAMAMELLPGGKATARLQNGWFIECIRDESDRAPLFNQWLAGDLPIRVADDLHMLAGVLECLILGHRADDMNHKTVKAYVAETGAKTLVPGLLGTFAHFASCLDRLMQTRSDYPALGGAEHVRQVLGALVRSELVSGLDEHGEVSGTVHVLHGKERSWVGSINAGEKIVRQPSGHPIIPKGDFVQFVLPPAERGQCVFGVELRLDDELVTAPWGDAAAWLAPRLHEQGKAALLFDDPVNDADAAYVDGDGDYGIRIVAVDTGEQDISVNASTKALLPTELTKLTLDAPEAWPTGYAEAMALVTYVERRARRAKSAQAGNARETARAAKFGGHVADLKPEPTRARLYRGQYRVV